jgi:hypothetical protein
MADYTTLIAFWATLPQPQPGDTTTIASNLAAINSKTINAPNVDVPVSNVAAYLFQNLKISQLKTYISAPPAGSNPEAVEIANLLVLIVTNQAPFPSFKTSIPSNYTALEGMLAMLVSDSNTGIVTEDQEAIVAMATGPSLVWHNTPTAEGGAGLSGDLVNAWDLFLAGLINESDAEAVEALA